MKMDLLRSGTLTFDFAIAVKYRDIEAAFLYRRLWDGLGENLRLSRCVDCDGIPWISATYDELAFEMKIKNMTRRVIRKSMQKMLKGGDLVSKEDPTPDCRGVWYSLPKDQWRDAS
jgi:hypothetical protein